MKKGIHPKTQECTVNCSCGNVMTIISASAKQNFGVDVCYQCHPFYTGKQRLVDTAGRIDKFKQRYQGKKAADAGKASAA